MTDHTLKALSFLLPAGLLGVSMTLAGAPASALPLSPEGAAAASGQNPGVAARLRAIRDGVSDVVGQSDGEFDQRKLSQCPQGLVAQLPQRRRRLASALVQRRLAPRLAQRRRLEKLPQLVAIWSGMRKGMSAFPPASRCKLLE